MRSTATRRRRELVATALVPDAPAVAFDPASVAASDPPVRAFFTSAVAPGTPLARAVRLTIRGHIRLGGRWMPFRSREVLDPMRGLAWWSTGGGTPTRPGHRPCTRSGVR